MQRVAASQCGSIVVGKPVWQWCSRQTILQEYKLYSGLAWFWLGFGLVLVCFGLVLAWVQLVFGKVLAWTRPGFGLVQAWFWLGYGLVLRWFWLGFGSVMARFLLLVFFFRCFLVSAWLKRGFGLFFRRLKPNTTYSTTNFVCMRLRLYSRLLRLQHTQTLTLMKFG